MANVSCKKGRTIQMVFVSVVIKIPSTHIEMLQKMVCECNDHHLRGSWLQGTNDIT